MASAADVEIGQTADIRHKRLGETISGSTNELYSELKGCRDVIFRTEVPGQQ